MLLDQIPLWALYATIILLFFLSVECGLLLGRSRTNLEAVTEGMTAQTATVLGALLALNGFLLAFTFSMAGGQFDSRRRLVIQDVNAIATTFLYTDQLPEPQRSNSRLLLGEYLDDRHLLLTSSRPELLANSESLHDRLWAEASAVAQDDRTPVLAIYLQSLNQMIDVHGERAHIEDWVRIPGMVIVTLAFLSLVSMTLTGYLLALRNRRYRIPTALMVLSYATVFLLVIDLDRPVQGLFSVSQDPIIELHGAVHTKLEREFPARGGRHRFP